MPKPLQIFMQLTPAKFAYWQIKTRVENLFEIAFWNSTGPYVILTEAFHSLALCLLLQLKIALFDTLNKTFLLRDANEMPKCYGDNGTAAAAVIAEENYSEQISEVIASDLMHFFTTRTKFKKLLNVVNQRVDAEEMEDTRQKFVGLVGISRFAMITDTNIEEIGKIAYDQKTIFELLYKEFFESNSKLAKWRTKIVLQKKLYDENANKFISGQTEKAINSHGKEKLSTFQEKINFIMKMKEIWLIYSDNFWLNEKKIKAISEQLIRKNKAKNLEMVNEALMAHKKELNETNWPKSEDRLMFWENGPEDCALLRALTICMRETAEDYWRRSATKGTAAENWDKLSVTGQWKMINCAGKHLRRNESSKKDGQMAKLQVDRMGELVARDDDGEEFGHILDRHKKLWGELLDAEGIKKMRKTLTEMQYFSADENISSCDDLSSAEKSDDEFADANVEESDDNENNEEGTVENEQIADQIMELNNDNENNFGANENAKNKQKNKAKNMNKKKEKKCQNVPTKSAEKERENEEEAKVPNKHGSATKYYHKIAKNKERKRKN